MNPPAIRLDLLLRGLGLQVGAGCADIGSPGPAATSGWVPPGLQAGLADLASPSPGPTTPTPREPCVIGAVCAWCLTSAVIMAVLTPQSLQPALQMKDTLP